LLDSTFLNFFICLPRVQVFFPAQSYVPICLVHFDVFFLFIMNHFLLVYAIGRPRFSCPLIPASILVLIIGFLSTPFPVVFSYLYLFLCTPLSSSLLYSPFFNPPLGDFWGFCFFFFSFFGVRSAPHLKIFFFLVPVSGDFFLLYCPSSSFPLPAPPVCFL